MGGVSSEKDISLRSGRAVVGALQKMGGAVVPLELASFDRNEVMNVIRQSGIQLAFIALHGKFGEDGTIQALLEELRIPYTGSGVNASACAFNKVTTQRTLRANGLPVADFYVAHALTANAGRIMEELKDYPVIAKPACEGSSFGVSIIHKEEEFPSALQEAFRFGNEIIVEKFISGRELTVGILDQHVLPVVEICAQNSMFDHQSKYQPGLTQYIVPAQLPEDVTKHIESIALKAHRALGCEGYSRVDFRLNEALEPFVLEVNTIPGFTETSLFPKAAKQAGIDFGDVCLKLIELAYGKKK